MSVVDMKCLGCGFSFLFVGKRNPGLCPKCGGCADPEPAIESHDDWTPEYSPWRHGGWYVHNAGYIDGTSGCVSRNYPDGKWRIVCDPRPFEEEPTFRTRDEAARAERTIALSADSAHAALQRERDHFNVMRERFGPDGSKAALHNWTGSAMRYCERYGHLPPADLVSVKIANQYAHLPEHPSDALDPIESDPSAEETITCLKCHGSGSSGNVRYRQCSMCKGTGTLPAPRPAPRPPDDPEPTIESYFGPLCDACGQAPTGDDPNLCRTCAGLLNSPYPATRRLWRTLLKNLAERERENGHAYVTYSESAELVRNDWHQPGHTIYRYSVPNEDLSDAVQIPGARIYEREMLLDRLKTFWLPALS